MSNAQDAREEPEAPAMGRWASLNSNHSVRVGGASVVSMDEQDACEEPEGDGVRLGRGSLYSISQDDKLAPAAEDLPKSPARSSIASMSSLYDALGGRGASTRISRSQHVSDLWLDMANKHDV